MLGRKVHSVYRNTHTYIFQLPCKRVWRNTVCSGFLSSHTSWFNAHTNARLTKTGTNFTLAFAFSTYTILLLTRYEEAWLSHVSVRFGLLPPPRSFCFDYQLLAYGRCCIFPVFPRENIYVTVRRTENSWFSCVYRNVLVDDEKERKILT